jgi:hypothetical protein
MTARADAIALLTERGRFPVGSPDYEYRTRAAWKLDQLSRGIPARDWTDTPPQQHQRAA